MDTSKVCARLKTATIVLAVALFLALAAVATLAVLYVRRH
jgi:hypothetical protein